MSTRVYEGGSSWNRVIATVSGNSIYKGSGTGGAPIAIIDGSRVFEGGSTWNRQIAVVSNGKVWLGSNCSGCVYATLNGTSIHEGGSTWNNIIGCFDGDDPNGALAAIAALAAIS